MQKRRQGSYPKVCIKSGLPIRHKCVCIYCERKCKYAGQKVRTSK